MSGPDTDVRQLLSLAAPDVTAPVEAGDDVERGRQALGRRRSLLATLAVGTGSALVAAAAVIVPQGLVGTMGPSGPPATSTGTEVDPPVDPALDPVPLVAGPAQHEDDVVATLVPRGWEIRSADAQSLVLGRDDEVVTVSPAPRTDDPPVLAGVGDFEHVEGARASYYLVDTTDGSARPTMVLELTWGTWAQVSVSPRLGWGMAELTEFATGLRAPFSCADPCEVPLAP